MDGRAAECTNDARKCNRKKRGILGKTVDIVTPGGGVEEVEVVPFGRLKGRQLRTAPVGWRIRAGARPRPT